MSQVNEIDRKKIEVTLDGLRKMVLSTSSTMNSQSKFVIQSLVLMLENLLILNEKHKHDIDYLRSQIRGLSGNDVKSFDILDFDIDNGEGGEFPFVSKEDVEDSISNYNTIKCLLCDFEGKLLTQHLRMAHQLTFIEYVKKLNLPHDYPSCSRSHSEKRKEIINMKNPKTGKSTKAELFNR